MHICKCWSTRCILGMSAGMSTGMPYEWNECAHATLCGCSFKPQMTKRTRTNVHYLNAHVDACYTYIHTYARPHTHTHTHTYTLARTRTCTKTHVHMGTNASTRTYIYVHTQGWATAESRILWGNTQASFNYPSYKWLMSVSMHMYQASRIQNSVSFSARVHGPYRCFSSRNPLVYTPTFRSSP